MTTATVDIIAKQKINIDTLSSTSKINTSIDLDNVQDLEKIKNNSYYYSTGSFNFIVDKGFKPETLEDIELTSVPFLPEWHEGIISVRGLIIPVIDILNFAKNQNIIIDESKALKKQFYLKLEHKDYSPIVFMLDSLPKLVDIDSCKSTKAKKDSPEWVVNHLENESMTIAVLDHKKLFEQLINKQ